MGIYIDTSALVKRYVHEPSSQAFDDFVAASDDELMVLAKRLIRR